MAASTSTAAAPAVVKAFALQPERVSFTNTVRTLDNGCKLVWVAYEGQPLVMQLPTMKAPFGLNCWSDGVAADKYSIDLSFGGHESDPKIRATLDAFKALDEQVLQAAIDNSQTWFKKKITSREVVEALYTPIVRLAKDEKFAPTVKLALPFRDGKLQAKCFDAAKAPIDIMDVNTKAAQVTAIVQVTGLWLAGSKLGVSMKAKQLKVVPKPSLNEYAFDDDEEDAAAASEGEGAGSEGDAGVYC